MILYHYTTKEAYDEMWRTKIFKPSNPWTTMDSAYGSGWYFTNIDNSQCESYIAYNCWRQPAFDRARYYFKYDITALIITTCRNNVYLVTSWDKDKIKLLEHGKNKPCSKIPHEGCDNYKKYFSQ